MYENTGARAHRMAAELIELGVDVHEIYRRVYEGVPYGKLALLARGLANVQRYDGGRLTVTELERRATSSRPAPRRATPRAWSTICARSRAPRWRRWCVTGSGTTDGDRQRKVSLRSSDDRVDVSAIARVQGGGGHRQAAGFSTAMEWDELVDFLREAVAEQLDAVDVSASRPSDGSHPLRQAGRASPRTTWWPRCAGAASAGSRSGTPARWTRSPPVCCWSWSAGPPASSAS